jgi:hypothetical protein
MPKMPKINIRSDKQIPEICPPISQNIKEIIVHHVTNTIKQWRMNLGYPIAEDLHELLVTLRKLRLDPSRCALGVRVSSMMSILGLDEVLYQFFHVIYKECISPIN